MTSTQYITSHRVRRNVPFLLCAQIFYTTLITFTGQYGEYIYIYIYIIYLFLHSVQKLRWQIKRAIYKTSINLFLYTVSLKKGFILVLVSSSTKALCAWLWSLPTHSHITEHSDGYSHEYKSLQMKHSVSRKRQSSWNRLSRLASN